MNADRTQKVTLGSVCSLTKGKSSSTKTVPGEYTLFLTAGRTKTADHYDFDGRGVGVPLISALGHGKAEVKRIHFLKNKFALANLLAFIQPNNEQELNPKFLYYYLDSHKNELAGLMRGTANVSMTIEDLKNFQILLPKPEVQEKAVQIIDTITSLVKSRTESIAVLSTFGLGLFHKMFGGLVNGDTRWKIAELGDVSTLVRGVSFDKEQVSQVRESDDDIPILRAGNIQYDLNLVDDLIYVSRRLVKPEQLLKDGDVAIAMSSGSAEVVGKTAQIHSDWNGSVGAFCAIIRFDCENVDPVFGATFLASDFIKREIRKSARGSNIKNLKRSDMLNLKIPVPPMDLQKEFAALINKARMLHEQQMKSQDKLKSALVSVKSFYL